MNLENLAKLAASLLCVIIAYFAYREVKTKKMLRPGDNHFFEEVKNGISNFEYARSWKLIIMLIVAAIALMGWAFENN